MKTEQEIQQKLKELLEIEKEFTNETTQEVVDKKFVEGKIQLLSWILE